MATAPEWVIEVPALSVNEAFTLLAPVIVVAPVPAKTTAALFVKELEKVYVAELFTVTADAITTGPANVMALVPVIV